MAFSVAVEMVNMRMRAKADAVRLRERHMPREEGSQA
jgi:hypothetical protein